MDRDALIGLVRRFAGRRILVIGDVVLDRYLVGRATRLSREAPVPILEFERELALPGAAANPANNIQALGGKAVIVGIVGDDEPGRALIEALTAAGIDTSGIVIDPSRLTTTKTRVVAEDGIRVRQQVVRIDRVDRQELDEKTIDAVTDRIERAIDGVDAVLFSDYRGGLVSRRLVDFCLGLAGGKPKVLTADSQGELDKFIGFTVVKCNQAEAEVRLGRLLSDNESFAAAARRLLNELRVQAVVITRGWDGMSVADKDGHRHIPVVNRSEVFDVTGAGDTVIAVLTLALTAGASLIEAAHLSNLAAGLVVRRMGNATVSPDELCSAIDLFVSRKGS